MPRRPEQFEEIREKSREKILSASLELFAQNGYDSTSIDSIAKKAGISKGLIYNYYESKQSILLAIFEDVMDQGEKLVNNYAEIKDPFLRMRKMMEEAFAMIEKNREYMKLLMVISLQPGVLEATKEQTYDMFKRNQQLISTIYKGKTKEDEITGLMMDALVDGIMLNYIRYGNQYPITALKERMIKDYCTPKTKSRSNVKK